MFATAYTRAKKNNSTAVFSGAAVQRQGYEMHTRSTQAIASSDVFFWRKKSNSDVFDQSVSLIAQIDQRCRNNCAQIFRDFSRIFDKSKRFGVRFHLLHPSSYTTGIAAH